MEKNHNPKPSVDHDPAAPQQPELFPELMTPKSTIENTETVLTLPPIPKFVEIPISSIDTDISLQCRVSVTEAVVDEYAMALRRRDILPPIHVIQNPTDGALKVADGFHRMVAYKQIGRTAILAKITVADYAEALKIAVTANSTHGLTRSNADKRNGVTKLLLQPEYTRWTNRRISRLCKVDHKTVSSVRVELENVGAIEPIELRVNKLGQVQKVSKLRRISKTVTRETVAKEIPGPDLVSAHAIHTETITGEIPSPEIITVPFPDDKSFEACWSHIAPKYGPTQTGSRAITPPLVQPIKSENAGVFSLLRDHTDSDMSISLSREGGRFGIQISSLDGEIATSIIDLSGPDPDEQARQIVREVLRLGRQK